MMVDSINSINTYTIYTIYSTCCAFHLYRIRLMQEGSIRNLCHHLHVICEYQAIIMAIDDIVGAGVERDAHRVANSEEDHAWKRGMGE